jgi:hypothetical protein
MMNQAGWWEQVLDLVGSNDGRWCTSWWEKCTKRCIPMWTKVTVVLLWTWREKWQLDIHKLKKQKTVFNIIVKLVCVLFQNLPETHCMSDYQK